MTPSLLSYGAVGEEQSENKRRHERRSEAEPRCPAKHPSHRRSVDGKTQHEQRDGGGEQHSNHVDSSRSAAHGATLKITLKTCPPRATTSVMLQPVSCSLHRKIPPGCRRDVSLAYRREPLSDEFRELFAKCITPEQIAKSGLSVETLVEGFFDDRLERQDTELTRQRLTLFRSSTRDIVNSHRMVNAVKGALRNLGVENADTEPTELPKLPSVFWDSGEIKKKKKR